MSGACCPGSRRQKLNDLRFRPADDGSVVFDDNRALQELLVLHEDIDYRLGIPDEIIGIKFEFLEFGVLSHQVLDRIFELGDNCLQLLLSGRGFNVKDDLVFDSKFAGDRQRIGRRTSVRVVVDRDFAHRLKMSGGGENAMPG
ncbi:MAG: hypothetical protein P1U68_12815 [Verrucomicrobiales bacterium]|nr:hypothetical protein [Verrucomicrobiales bacterium]